MLKTLFGPSMNTLTEAQQACRWRDLSFDLKVSRQRRSIGFRVQAQGITVSVPYGIDERLLERALADKYDWLQSNLAHAQQQAANLPRLPTQLRHGDAWPVFGDWLPLHIEQGDCHQVVLTDDYVQLTFTNRQQGQAGRWRLWQQWYRQQALAFAEHRVDYWLTAMAPQLPRLPTSVSVRQYRRRWGSCSSHGELKFNYLLAMVPREVFDYVVVHELCHLKHMHHGKEFWQMVAAFCPQWQHQRRWLQHQGGGLLMELST